MHTAMLRQQHVELGAALTKLLERARSKAPGSELRTLLVEISGKLTMHLAAEDRIVYPKLIAAADAQVAAMAKRFVAEMGGLGAAFKDFSHRFSNGAAIDADRIGFTTGLEGIVAAIGKRVRAEEGELYPAADRLAG